MILYTAYVFYYTALTFEVFYSVSNTIMEPKYSYILFVLSLMLEPELRDEDTDDDNIAMGNDPRLDVVHGHLQDKIPGANNRFYLPDHTHDYALIGALLHVKRELGICSQDIEENISGTGWRNRVSCRRCPQENNFFWFTEVSEGGQRDAGVGDEVDGIQIAADVVWLAGFNTTHID